AVLHRVLQPVVGLVRGGAPRRDGVPGVRHSAADRRLPPHAGPRWKLMVDFLDLTLPTAEENLALDEALLLEAEAGRRGETLRLWEHPHPAVVLGAGCRLLDDVDD